MATTTERHRRLAAKRKAARHAIKAKLPHPRCQQCDEVITDARQLVAPETWARRYCSGACRQAAYRIRRGE